MTNNKLITTIRKANATSIIDIQGEVTGFSENTLMDAYTQASNGNAKAILLNFSQLEYLNSSGIGLIVTLLIRTQRQKQKLMACGLTEHYQEIFKLTRLNEAIGIFGTEAEALAAV
ncbi:MAG: STAS domain-containing protein [Anaerolineales bacterium]|jgi:anti-sigma B factor antagonist|nr:STAS domain-containing protein [Anaerolineales bacterium]